MLNNALKIFLGVALISSSANATTLLFQLTISGTGSPVNNFDVSSFKLENLSTVAATITNFKLTIGDTGYNFDRTSTQSFSGTFTRTPVTPDNVNGSGGVRSNTLEWNYTGFGQAESHTFSVEFDRDNPPTFDNIVDFRTILFNNGGDETNNALLTVTFLQGAVTTIQSFRLPDQTPGQTSYTFSTPIPEPGTMAIFGMGLGAILLSRFRRRS